MGNRTEKTDVLNATRVDYYYDIDDPERFDMSANNRLMYYETYDTSMFPVEILESTTYYYYNCAGNVIRIVTHDESSGGGGGGIIMGMAMGGPGGGGLDACGIQYGPAWSQYKATRLEYAKNGQTVTYAIGEEWCWNGGGYLLGYDLTYAREFRYDGARQ